MEAAEPTEPVEPVEPVQPAQPAQPAQLAQPAQSAQPAQPAQPTEPYIFLKKNGNEIKHKTKKAFTLFESSFPGIKKITSKEKFVFIAPDVQL